MDEIILRSLRGEADPAEELALAAWRRESPANEARYRDVQRVWTETAILEPQARSGTVPTAASLLQQDSDGVQDSRGVSVARHWWRGIAAAAAVLLVALAISQYERSPTLHGSVNAAQYVTGPADMLTVPLGDGSVVRLAPSSRLSVVHDEARREVWLEGRAHFWVARQDSKPFRVRTTAGDAVVLGTRFDLHAVDRELRLAVVEGRVALIDGNQGEVRVDGGHVSAVVEARVTGAVPVANVREMVSWIGNFLVFDETPLLEVAAELIAQYGVEVRIDDRSLEGRTITGWFSDQTYDEVVAAICRVIQARCTIESSRIVIGA